MTVRAEKIPSTATVRMELDRAARNAAREAQREMRLLVVEETEDHIRTGAMARALVPRVIRGTGAAAGPGGISWGVEISPMGRTHPSGPSIAAVIHFVNKGTAGGPPGRIYPRKAKKLKLPWGSYSSVYGQQPTYFFDRILAGAIRVDAIYTRGATEAAARIQRRV